MIGALRSLTRVVPLALLVTACASSLSPSAGGGMNVDPGAFLGSSWTVRSIDATATLPDSPPTMTFAANGMVSGHGGCNEYSGPFQLDGGSVSVGDITATLMLCEGERGAQETAFLNALRSAQTVRVMADGTLEIAGGGSIVAVPGIAEGPPPQPGAGLAGTSWDLIEMGATGDFARIVPTIEFEQDGTVSGFAACNTFSGTFSVDGEQLALGPLATTRMACVPPASNVETQYLRALSGVTSWSITPDGNLLLGGDVPLRYAPR